MKMLMASKVRSAEVELEETKRQFHRMSDYLRRRWYQHREVMTRYNVILQEEVEREWEERERGGGGGASGGPGRGGGDGGQP